MAETAAMIAVAGDDDDERKEEENNKKKRAASQRTLTTDIYAEKRVKTNCWERSEDEEVEAIRAESRAVLSYRWTVRYQGKRQQNGARQKSVIYNAM
uniref:Uncharacterized protein n=1 Tax=Leersia perrieri TaxID=77586 RepID=A0A0D9VKF0_9ORYZ